MQQKKPAKKIPTDEPRNHIIPIGDRYLSWRFTSRDLPGLEYLQPVLCKTKKVDL